MHPLSAYIERFVPLTNAKWAPLAAGETHPKLAMALAAHQAPGDTVVRFPIG
jgi:hypothetical protein